MLSRPLVLAALADAAVPGLLPIQISVTPVHGAAEFQHAVVTAQDGTRWQVQSALGTAAAAGIYQAAHLVPQLQGWLSVRPPQIAGIARTRAGGIVAVYPEPAGAPVPLAEVQPRSDLARALGSALAEVHDLDPRLFEQAGLVSYSADEYRSRRLVDLDRAAATGEVPAVLLARWERALEEVSLWRFATTPTHGAVGDHHVWADGPHLTALDGWHDAAIADPAIDFALLYLNAPAETVDTVLESYAQARHERPDPHLERRIRLAAELHLLTDLMVAHERSATAAVRETRSALEELATLTADDDSLMPGPVGPRRSSVVVAPEADSVDPAEVAAVAAPDTAEDETIEIPVRRAGATAMGATPLSVVEHQH